MKANKFIYLISLFLIILCCQSIAKENINKELAEKRFNEGLKYYKNKEYQKAIDIWQELIEMGYINRDLKKVLNGTYDTYHEKQTLLLEGIKQYENNQYDEALNTFNKIAAIVPNDTKTGNYLNQTKKVIKKIEIQKEIKEDTVVADQHMKNGNWEDAMKIYKSILLLDENNKIASAKISKAKTHIDNKNRKNEAQLHLKNGNNFFNQKQYTDAMREWQKVLLLDPDNSEAKEFINEAVTIQKSIARQNELKESIQKGIENYNNNNYEESKKMLQKALSIDEGNQEVKKYLTLIENHYKQIREQQIIKAEAEMHYKSGISLYNQKQYLESKNEFESTLALIPGHSGAKEYLKRIEIALIRLEKLKKEQLQRKITELLNQGLLHYHNQEYQAAVDKLDECLRLDPENQYAKEYIGMAKMALLEKGEEEVSEDSSYYEIIQKLRRIAQKHYILQEYDQSMKYWEKIVTLFPANKEAREEMTLLATKIDPQFANRFIAQHMNTGKLFYQNKEYKRALKEFEMIVKISPDYPQLQDYLKKTKSKLEKPPTVRIPNSVLKEYYETGLRYYSQGKLNDALNYWNKVLKDNSSENPYRVKAIVNIDKIKRKMKSGDSDRRTAEKKALPKKDQAAIKSHYLKGVAFYVNGEYEKALKEWELVLELDPEHVNARNNIGKLKRKIGIK